MSTGKDLGVDAPSASSAEQSPLDNAAVRGNPYVGPRSFRTGEKLFGRGRETDELVDLLIAERIVLMSSPSGAGKTSLINAAIIPQMRAHGFKVYGPIRVGWSPTSDVEVPAGANRFVLSLLLSLEESRLSLAGARSTKRDLPIDSLARMTFSQYLDSLEGTDAASDSVLFVFDQFEEIQTIGPSQHAARLEFFEQVGQALRKRSRWSLFAMREEYVAALQPYGRAIPTRLATSFRLELLSNTAASEAIGGPAREAGIAFEAEAGDELVRYLSTVRVLQSDGTMAEAPGNTVEPVQLQVVCRRLWETLPSEAATIDLGHVRSVGNLDSALVDYYEAVAADAGRVVAGGERAVREWVEKSLITSSGIRGEIMQEPHATAGLENDAIRKLVDNYLVREDKRRGNTWYELAHDSLIKPIGTSNADWLDKHLHPMQRQAKLWEREGRPDRLLMRGRPLRDAESWASQHGAVLLPVEADLLIRSAKRRRFDRAASAVLALFIVGLTSLTAFSVISWQKAVREHNRADAELRNSQTTQSLMLADRANGALAEGDSVTAMLLGLAGMPVPRAAPQSPGDRPYVPQAELSDYQAYIATHESFVLTDSESGTRNNPVNTVAISADGRRIVTGANDAVRIWDVATQSRVQVIKTDSPVRHIGINLDGTLVVAASDDDVIHRWDAKTGAEIVPSLRDTGPVKDLAMGPDGRHFVTGAGNVVRLWNIATGEHKAMQSDASLGAILSVALSEDGRRIVAGTSGEPVSKAYVWDTASGKVVAVLPDPTIPRSVAINADGSRVMTNADYPWAANIWIVDQNKIVFRQTVLNDKENEVVGVAYGQKHDLFATASGKAVHVFRSTETPSIPMLLRGHTRLVTSVTFTPDAAGIITRSDDGTARLWQLEPKSRIVSYKPTLGRAVVSSLVYDTDGKLFIGLVEGSNAHIRDGHTAKPIGDLTVPSAHLAGVALSPTATRVIAWSDGVAVVSDLSGDHKVNLPVTKGQVSRAVFSPDGTLVATGGDENDRTIRLWDATTGQPRFKSIKVPVGRVASLLITPGNEKVVTGSGTTVRVWDVTTGEQIKPLSHAGSILCLAVSADGKRLISGSRDRTAVVWNLTTYEKVATLAGHPGSVSSVAISNDGSRALTGTEDALRLWDASTGNMVGALNVPDNIGAIALSQRDGEATAVLAEKGLQQFPFFPHWTSLVHRAEQAAPRCLTPEQLEAFHLPLDPPRWCITGADHQGEADKSKWTPIWPYQSNSWRDWQAALDDGQRLPRPKP
jgi:WD40 repeat protein